MAGRAAVPAPGHPARHALALRDSQRRVWLWAGARGGWAGSSGMLRSSSRGWPGSARCLRTPGTCSPRNHTPKPAGTQQWDKDPQVWECTSSLTPQRQQHPSLGMDAAPHGAGGAGPRTRGRVEIAQQQSPPVPAQLLPTSSCHPQQWAFYGPRACGAKGPQPDPQPPWEGAQETRKETPTSSKAPQASPAHKVAQPKGLPMVPFPQQSLCPQPGDPLENGKSTLESARG